MQKRHALAMFAATAGAVAALATAPLAAADEYGGGGASLTEASVILEEVSASGGIRVIGGLDHMRVGHDVAVHTHNEA